MPAVAELLRWALVAVLVATAGAKLAGGAASRRALATYGLTGRAAMAGWAVVVGAELAVAVGLALGAGGAPLAGALLALVFVAAQAMAIVQGKLGAPCACFGAAGHLGRGSLARGTALAVACALLPILEAFGA